jgi:hypothetical protein
MTILKIIIIGYLVLIGAIGLNALSSLLNIKNWYEFIKNPSKTSPLSYLWLFVVYPASLGAISYALRFLIK